MQASTAFGLPRVRPHRTFHSLHKQPAPCGPGYGCPSARLHRGIHAHRLLRDRARGVGPIAQGDSALGPDIVSFLLAPYDRSE
jgi:hypothetical protein